MAQIPISAVIIAYNEEKKIETSLRSLAWADEILVVDGNSTDRTREICLNTSKPWSDKIRLVQRSWTGFKDQRNFSIEQAKYDWILVVDADEECTPELASKIQSLLNNPGGPERTAYKVHRSEFFMGKPILHGMWNPSYQDRLFHRRGVRYINDVHEYPIFPQPPGQIHESLLHKADLTIEKYIDKMNRYTTIEAQDRFNQGQRTTLFRMVFAFPAHFLKTLFYYGAYKDGIHGVVIALLEGVSRAVRQLKIWQIMQFQKKGKFK